MLSGPIGGIVLRKRPGPIAGAGEEEAAIIRQGSKNEVAYTIATGAGRDGAKA